MRTNLAKQALARVGLAGFEHRKPHELSGGQQQRVALARSFAPRPRVILLDEPFSNFDAALRAEARTQVREILKGTGTSAILVTHDQEEALTVADRIAVMNHGVVEQIGDPISVYRRPATAFVAQFLGSTNLIEADGQGACAHCSLGCFDVATEAKGAVLLSIRPEQLAITAGGEGALSGTIEARHFKGHDQLYRVRLGDQFLYAMTDHKSDFRKGQRVSLKLTEPAVVVQSGTH
jgi:iron(III) transport system ATP-binding protein